MPDWHDIFIDDQEATEEFLRANPFKTESAGLQVEDSQQFQYVAEVPGDSGYEFFEIGKPEGQPEEDRVLIVHNGWMCDADTGEALYLVGVQESFVPNTEEGVNWVMEKFTDTDGEILAEEAKLESFIARKRKVITALKNRRKWLEIRFGADLQKYAEDQFAAMERSKKPSSLRTDFGTLKFTATRGTITVKEEAAAILWARENAPWAVRTQEKISITELKGHESLLPDSLFQVTEPGRNFSIKTELAAPKVAGEISE